MQCFNMIWHHNSVIQSHVKYKRHRNETPETVMAALDAEKGGIIVHFVFVVFVAASNLFVGGGPLEELGKGCVE